MKLRGDEMKRTPPRSRQEYAAFRTIQTRWMDNDFYGHMNNAVHYSLFDTAVNGWLIEQGLLDLNGSGTVFLVVETGCKYFSEMAFPDVISAGIRLAHLGNSSLKYEVGLFRNDEETASAEGQFVHVHVDRKSHAPVPLSDGQRLKLKRLLTG